MSKKHFVAFAEAISNIQDKRDRKMVAELVARVCSYANQNFNWSKFMRACGVED